MSSSNEVKVSFVSDVRGAMAGIEQLFKEMNLTGRSWHSLKQELVSGNAFGTIKDGFLSIETSAGTFRTAVEETTHSAAKLIETMEGMKKYQAKGIPTLSPIAPARASELLSTKTTTRGDDYLTTTKEQIGLGKTLTTVRSAENEVMQQTIVNDERARLKAEALIATRERLKAQLQELTKNVKSYKDVSESGKTKTQQLITNDDKIYSIRRKKDTQELVDIREITAQVQEKREVEAAKAAKQQSDLIQRREVESAKAAKDLADMREKAEQRIINIQQKRDVETAKAIKDETDAKLKAAQQVSDIQHKRDVESAKAGQAVVDLQRKREVESARASKEAVDLQRKRELESYVAESAVARNMKRIQERRELEAYHAQNAGTNRLDVSPVRGTTISSTTDNLLRQQKLVTEEQTKQGTILRQYVKTIGTASNQWKMVRENVKEAVKQHSFVSENMHTIIRLAKIYASYRAFGAVTSSAREYIDALIDVNKWTQLTQTISQDFGATSWQSTITNVSGTIGRDFNETGEALYNLISNQVAKSQEEAKQLLLAAGDFANTTNSTMQNSVELITAVMNAYRLPTSDVNKIAAQFFTTIDIGRVSANELGNSLGRVAILGEQLGISIEEIQAALAMLTIRGMDTGEAITQLRGLMTAFIKPTADAQKQIESMGFASGQEMSKLLGLAGALKLIGQNTNNLSELAEWVPRQRGISLAAMMVEANGAAEFSKNVDTISNSLDRYGKAVNIVNESAALKGKKLFQNFVGSGVDLAYETFNGLASLLPELKRHTVDLTASLTNADNKFKELSNTLDTLDKQGRQTMYSLRQAVNEFSASQSSAFEDLKYRGQAAADEINFAVSEIQAAYAKINKAYEMPKSLMRTEDLDALRAKREAALSEAAAGRDVIKNLAAADDITSAIAAKQSENVTDASGIPRMFNMDAARKEVEEYQKARTAAIEAAGGADAVAKKRYQALELQNLATDTASFKVEKLRLQTEEDLNKVIEERKSKMAKIEELSAKTGVNADNALKTQRDNITLLEEMRKGLKAADEAQKLLTNQTALKNNLPLVMAQERMQQMQQNLQRSPTNDPEDIKKLYGPKPISDNFFKNLVLPLWGPVEDALNANEGIKILQADMAQNRAKKALASGDMDTFKAEVKKIGDIVQEFESSVLLQDSGIALNKQFMVDALKYLEDRKLVENTYGADGLKTPTVSSQMVNTALTNTQSVLAGLNTTLSESKIVSAEGFSKTTGKIAETNTILSNILLKLQPGESNTGRMAPK